MNAAQSNLLLVSGVGIVVTLLGIMLQLQGSDFGFIVVILGFVLTMVGPAFLPKPAGR